jgi:hypothetical protein
MGHSDIKMTMRYAHLGRDELRASIKLLAPSKRIGVLAGRKQEMAQIKNPA